jgi:hypothetical protein
MFAARSLFLAVVAALFAIAASAAAETPAGVVRTEFLYDKAPFPECHASTIIATKSGVVAALFGGTHEKHRDVGIWVSRHDGERWGELVEAALCHTVRTVIALAVSLMNGSEVEIALVVPTARMPGNVTV